jgi:hypothetical protein
MALDHAIILSLSKNSEAILTAEAALMSMQ